MSKMNLLVFDFDWSLVNENSDTYIFKKLEPSILQEIKSERSPGGWTALMDDKLVKLQRTTSVELKDIAEVMGDLPVLPKMLESVSRAKSRDVYVAIVSDANQFYIDSFLEKHNLTDLISEIHTNKSRIDKMEVATENQKLEEKDILRVSPYQSANSPHMCELCPPNMCKGLIVDDMIKRLSPEHICYVGDGSGDFCAATRLREQDSLLVRNDKEYRSALGLVKRINREKDEHPVIANIIYWKRGEEVLDTINQVF